jgi:ketosteroid isomerase-like protein
MTPAETTKVFFELFASGRIEEMLERFVEADAVLDNPLPDVIPFGGKYEGHHGFVVYVQKILAAIAIEQFEIDEIFAEADRVCVLGRETSRVLATGKHYTMSWVHVLTVRDGRVQHLREYNDTAAMAAAFA